MTIFILISILVSNAFTLRKDKSILYSRSLLLNLLISTYLVLDNLNISMLEKGLGIYGGLFHVTPLTQTFNIFIYIISVLILVITSFYPRTINIENLKKLILIVIGVKSSFLKNNKKIGEDFKIIEYPLIIVFVISGAIFLMSASDLISIFLSIELQSYGLYIISTLHRDSEKATSGGLTYFLLGGLSSCFILLGSSLLYVNTATSSLDGLYLISSMSETFNNVYFTSYTDLSENMIKPWYKLHYIHISLIILSVGFLFKISAAPFHFWSPDVYDAIPTKVTTFVALIAKISIFVFLFEVLYYTDLTYTVYSWKNSLITSALFSLIIGSILGLTQTRIKRLYAYSTINHVGFILLALSVNTLESIQAFIFYIIIYTLSNLNAFLILIAIGYSLYLYIYVDENEKNNLQDRSNSPVQLVSEIKGYYYLNSYLALSLTITLFSFIGIPPLIGFFAKQMVLSAALDNGFIFISLVAIITSVIGAVYYLSLVKQLFFYNNTYILNKLNLFNILNNLGVHTGLSLEDIRVINTGLTSIISILTLLLISFIMMPGEWFGIGNVITSLLFNP